MQFSIFAGRPIGIPQYVPSVPLCMCVCMCVDFCVYFSLVGIPQYVPPVPLCICCVYVCLFLCLFQPHRHSIVCTTCAIMHLLCVSVYFCVYFSLIGIPQYVPPVSLCICVCVCVFISVFISASSAFIGIPQYNYLCHYSCARMCLHYACVRMYLFQSSSAFYCTCCWSVVVFISIHL